MSTLGMARMLTALMPEEIILEKTIKALQKYQKEKFGETEEIEKVPGTLVQKELSKGGLADFFKSNKHKDTPRKLNPGKEGVPKPMSEVMMLTIKFQDDGMKMEDIMKESEQFEEQISRIKP
jgi:hypothetical protein